MNVFAQSEEGGAHEVGVEKIPEVRREEGKGEERRG